MGTSADAEESQDESLLGTGGQCHCFEACAFNVTYCTCLGKR